MVDPLTIPGGIASFAQILGMAITSCDVLTKFCLDIHDAPTELHRLRDKLTTLNIGLKGIQNFIEDVPNDKLLPPDLRELLAKLFKQVQSDISALEDVRQVQSKDSPKSIRRRIRWALVDKHSTEKMVQHLRESESTLTGVLQLLNFRYSLLACLMIKRGGEIEPNTSYVRSCARVDIPLAQYWSIVLGVDSWLRKLGIYGSFVFTSNIRSDSWKSKIEVGYIPPAWLCSRSISLDVQLSSIAAGQLGIQILPGSIRVQNRVPLDSPFMTACRRGDVRLIQQHLASRTGFVGDRSTCTGQTPLMLSVEGRHLGAIQCLLDAGADPNVGDDDQILPIFAVVGMRARSNSPLPQIPPEWESWFDALQLLVKHGGSVHEVVYNRPLATCLIARNDREPRILDFFRLLLSENYYDFGAVVGSKSFSAVQNAIRARGQAYPALKMLTAAGVDVSKLMDDGRSPLHVAAEVAYDVKALEYLCANGSLGDINRQDKWGWTSLHYSILSEYYGSCPVSFAKVQFLLSQGADPNIKAETPLPYLIHKGIPETPFTPAELCSSLKPTILSGYVEALKENGHLVPSDLEDEVFFDAIDYDIGPSICS